MYFSAFAPFGMLDFSSDASEGEKIYDAMVAAYMDPRDGKASLDLSVDETNHQEAKLYATAMAIAAARVTLRRAHAQLRPATSYELLEAHEYAYDTRPTPSATIQDRRNAIVAKQKQARGARLEAVVDGLRTIIGDDLLAYRPVATGEAVAWPADPEHGPGVFVRHDRVAKSVRILDAIARCGAKPFVCDSYSESNQDGTSSLGWSTFLACGQSFTGDGRRLYQARLHARKFGSPTGLAYAKIYAFDTALELPGSVLGDVEPLATSEPLDVSTLTTSLALTAFTFKGDNKITLTSGVAYALVVEYSDPSASVSHNVRLGTDSSAPVHAGIFVNTTTDLAWTNDDTIDLCFYVDTEVPFNLEVEYESWSSHADVALLAGDVLAVDCGNLGLAEKVTVTSVREDADGRRFFGANFYRPHSAGAYATTGPTPIWLNTKRHVLVVIDSDASIDPSKVASVDAFMNGMSRGPTTWTIVQPTTPGAMTTGPFKIGSTLGSPLGAVPVEQLSFSALP